MTAASTSPYLLDEPPTSTGKALLARAFWHWCALQHGHSPEEIAAAVAYLASADAGFTTGQVLSVSGGLTM